MKLASPRPALSTHTVFASSHIILRLGGHKCRLYMDPSILSVLDATPQRASSVFRACHGRLQFFRTDQTAGSSCPNRHAAMPVRPYCPTSCSRGERVLASSSHTICCWTADGVGFWVDTGGGEGEGVTAWQAGRLRCVISWSRRGSGGIDGSTSPGDVEYVNVADCVVSCNVMDLPLLRAIAAASG